MTRTLATAALVFLLSHSASAVSPLNGPSGLNANCSTVAPSGTVSTSPTSTGGCALSGLPALFYIQDSAKEWLSVSTASSKALGTSDRKKASVFTTNSTSIDGSRISQLALQSDKNELSAAWVQEGGSDVVFLDAARLPGNGGGWEAITATFSSYLCELVLIPFLDHDDSSPENCNGTLFLGTGSKQGCRSIRLTVAPLD